MNELEDALLDARYCLAFDRINSDECLRKLVAAIEESGVIDDALRWRWFSACQAEMAKIGSWEAK